jgi:Sulfotransferase family
MDGQAHLEESRHPQELRYRSRLYDREELARARAEGRRLAAAAPQSLSRLQRFCGFIGYSQSGHTLVGSLVNAHPDAVIAHELDVLHLVAEGLEREELFALILARDREFAALGRRWTGYDYEVPGGHQGATEAPLVIGDKKGQRSTRRLIAEPALLERLRDRVMLPLSMIHVVRDPHDTIASICRHAGDRDLDRAIAHYATLAEANSVIRDLLEPGELLDLHLEELIAEPCVVLRRVCDFLNLEPDSDYLERCAAIVLPSPNRPSREVTWSTAQRVAVGELLVRHDFLNRYVLRP